MWFIPSPGRVRGGVERIAKSRFVPFGGRVLGGVKRHRAMLTRGLTVRRKFLGPSSRSQAALDAEHHFIEESLRDGDGFGPAERPKDTQLGYSLELSIPRAELEQGAAGSVVFVVALTTYKEGITHAWQLRKRYSYFERLHRGVVAETAAAAGVSVPALRDQCHSSRPAAPAGASCRQKKLLLSPASAVALTLTSDTVATATPQQIRPRQYLRCRSTSMS